MTLDEWYGAICDPQSEAMDEEEGEQTVELAGGGENAPTFDELIAAINEVEKVYDQRETLEQEENGMENAENMLYVREVGDNAKATLQNETFIRLTNNSTTPAPYIVRIMPG